MVFNEANLAIYTKLLVYKLQVRQLLKDVYNFALRDTKFVLKSTKRNTSIKARGFSISPTDNFLHKFMLLS